MRALIGLILALQATLGLAAGRKDFFENSRRIDAPKNLRAGIAHINTGCAGFFLKNAGNRNFVATARHCFKYNDAAWCAKSDRGIKDVASGSKLRCKRIVAGDTSHDFIIFEAEASQRDRSGDFELASFGLEKDMRLEMLGFPADPFAARQLKLSQHCWVNAPTSMSRYNLADVINDETFLHNCSTYGGNSGGPLFLEGTRIAVGIPDHYSPNNFSMRSRSANSQGVLTSGFIVDFAKEIEAAGIVVAKQAPLPKPKPNYRTEGVFASTNSSCVATLTKIAYNTSINPVQMNFDFSAGCPQFGWGPFTCARDNECTNTEDQVIKWQGLETFTLLGETYQKSLH